MAYPRVYERGETRAAEPVGGPSGWGHVLYAMGGRRWENTIIIEMATACYPPKTRGREDGAKKLDLNSKD